MTENPKPPSTLRWGLLSTASINRALIPVLRKSERSQLLAVASRDAERALTYAQQWEIPRAYASYEDLLSDPEIDVIYNSLPNHLHAEWSIRAVQAGKHVLCEKPLALSLDEVDAMIQASQAHSRVIAEAFMYRHHPQTLRVKQIVESGRLGELRLIRGAFSFNMEQSENVRMKPELGGGSLWDVGCYPVSYARTLVGQEPLEAFGWQKKQTGGSGPSGVDIVFSGQLRFPGKVFAQFDCGFNVASRSFVEVAGVQGSLVVLRPFTPGRIAWLLLSSGRTLPRPILVTAPPLYLGEVQDMEAAVLDGQAPRISLQDSRSNTAALLALLASAQKGKPKTV